MRRFLARHGRGIVGIVIASLVILAAVAAPWLVPHDPLQSDFAAGLRPPGSPGHPLGTDQLGRDLLARVLYGARVALFIGLCCVLLTAVVGGLLGLLAGYFEGWTGALLMRLADVQLSFPFILLALTINAIDVPKMMATSMPSSSMSGSRFRASVMPGRLRSMRSAFRPTSACSALIRTRSSLRRVA